MTNYYEILGVSRDATESMIRERFRVLAREAHPDRQRDPDKKRVAEDRFQLLTEAVNVLTNEARRKAHDFELEKDKPVTQDPQAIGRLYLAKGVKSYKEGLFQEALSFFEMAVGHYDKDAKAYHYLALACIKVMGKGRRGVEAIEAAIKLDANNGLFRRDAGKLYLMAGLHSKAVRHLEAALEWFPEDPETKKLYAEAKENDHDSTKPRSGSRPRSGIFGPKG